MRRAAVLAGLGLLVQLGAAFHWTPLTFIASAVVGLPLVGAGALLFLRAVVQILKGRGAL
jgi:TRAP-type C4-dicarboxylate transport system permease small subunit